MIAPWLPVVVVDIAGSVLAGWLSFWCLRLAWVRVKKRPEDIFSHYIFSLTVSIAVFAVSRSFGHLVKQILLYSDMRHVWQEISPYSGAVNTATFIIVFAIAMYFQRLRIIHDKDKQYKQHLEDLVQERTADLEVINASLESEVADRIAAQSNLAAEKERLAVTLRSIGDAVITTDTSGCIQLLNKGAEKITGWKQAEVIGRPLSEIFKIVDSNTGKILPNPVEKVLAAGQIIELIDDIILISKNGDERSIADSCAPILDENSDVVGAVLVFRDITERKIINEQLAKMQKLETVGVLAGGIAHDFNNILQGILGNLSLAKLHEAPESKTYDKLLETEKAALRAKDLTQQLLTFSKGGEPIKNTASIPEIIKESCSFVIHGSKITCEYSIPDDLWLANIDKGQISQVFQNLGINAREAMPKGGTINISCENFINEPGKIPGLNKREYIKITFKDNGPGLPTTIKDKIFDPFFTTKQDGSGLGLAICHSVITKHEGQIFVDSKPGKGTAFYFYLPADVHCKPQSPHVPQKVKTPASHGPILVMDDDKTVQAVAESMLTMLGYDVSLASSGEEAIEKYRQAMNSKKPIELVIMDLTIPAGMGGKEAIRELLKIDPHAKAIVSSGYSNDPVMANCQHYGFQAVINKPYTVSELRDTVASALQI